LEDWLREKESLQITILKYKSKRMRQNTNFAIRWLIFVDVQNGFKILAPTPVVIQWKTDPREILFNYPELVREENGLTTAYPIQIGKIIVKENTIYKKQGWSILLFNSGNGIKAYKKVKSALEEMMRDEGITKG